MILAVAMVGADDQDPGQLTVGAGRRLQADRLKPADLRQPLLQGVHQRQVPLQRVGILQRVGQCETRQASGVLVDLGVVLHGAGAQRIEAGVHCVIELRKPHEMAHHLQLRQLRQQQLPPFELGRQR